MNTKPVQITSSVRTGSKAACAEFFDVSLPTVEAWIRRGMPVVQKGSKGVAWVIDLLAAAQWRFAGQSDGSADPDTMTPTDRKAWYEGETKRRDLQIRDGELIPSGDVERVVATAFAALSSDIRSIPDNLERKYGIAGDVAESVEALLHEAMDAMADRLSKLAPVEDSE